MLFRWRELHYALLLCVQLIKPNKPLIIWSGSRPVGSRVYWKFGLISIVAVSCLFSTETVFMHIICDTRMCVFMLPEEKKCWLIHIVDHDRRSESGKWQRVREQTRIIPQPDPLTQCCNPLLCSSCLTLTKHLQDTMLLMSFFLPGMNVPYLCNWLIVQPHHFGSVCLTQPSNVTGSCLSVWFFFVFFSPDRIIYCLEVSQDAPILVLVCVYWWVSLYDLLLTYLEQQASLSRLPHSLSLLLVALSVMRDRCCMLGQL